MKHTMSDLYQMQSLPLKYKIQMTKQRIKAWYEHYDGEVCVSFSGGKDSTVLVDIVNDMGYTDIPLVYVDTGLEYPEVRDFVKSYGDRVVWLKPKMNFRQVVEKYGYPFISKEVSECVYGARKYLTKLLETEKSLQTDRQTDRPYRYRYEKLTATGTYQKYQRRKTPLLSIRNVKTSWNMQTKQQSTSERGGADNKYRKLKGIGEYKSVHTQRTFSNDVRSVRKELEREEESEYP